MATELIKIVLLAAMAGGVIANTYLAHQDSTETQAELRRVVKAVKEIEVAGGGGGQRDEKPSTGLEPEKFFSDTDPAWGPKDARVVIVEYSDFQCPFCKRFAQQTAEKIRSKYEDKVRFVFKHLPLKSIHPHAMGAAVAAQCANEQGKFWEYYQTLFANQTNLDTDALASYAGTAKLDTKAFGECVQRKDIADKVERDIQSAIELGVTGTPGFIIAGTKLSGAQPFEVFDRAISQALEEN